MRQVPQMWRLAQVLLITFAASARSAASAFSCSWKGFKVEDSAARNKLKKAALHVIAGQMTDTQIKDSGFTLVKI